LLTTGPTITAATHYRTHHRRYSQIAKSMFGRAESAAESTAVSTAESTADRSDGGGEDCPLHTMYPAVAWVALLTEVVAVPPAVTNKAAAPSLPVPKKKPPVPVKQLVKPPDPDTKYLSQILSVPKPDQLCSDDDLE
nr:hypothetical protein [Tanacetum cinerariifolium]